MAVARPAVRLLSWSASAVLRAFDIPKTERAASIHSAEELKLIATAAQRLGLLPEFQEMLVHRSLELSDTLVREIMTPRQKIFSLPSNMPQSLARSCLRRVSRPRAHCGRRLCARSGADDFSARDSAVSGGAVFAGGVSR
jgi:CBS domain containing-hemolysin-like protein